MKANRRVIGFALAVLLGVALLSLPAVAKDYLYVPTSNYLHVVDCEKDTVVKTLSYNDYIVGCTPSNDGRKFFFNSWRRIYEVDTATDKLVDVHEFWSDLNQVNVVGSPSVSADGNYLYLSCYIARKKLNVPRLTLVPPQLVVYDLKKKQIAKSFEIPHCCTYVLPLRDDPDHVIVMAQDIYSLNLKDGKMTKVLGVLRPDEGKPGLNNLALWNHWSPGDAGVFINGAYTVDGKMWYVLFDKKGKLDIVETEEAIAQYSSIISADRKYAYSAMDEVYKIDLATGKTMAMDPIEKGTCYSLALTTDGKKLYIGPGGPDLSVYDAGTMKRIGVIQLKSDGMCMSRISK
ncbi:MAG: hypothetical protein AB1640_04905 [bacterium]